MEKVNGLIGGLLGGDGNGKVTSRKWIALVMCGVLLYLKQLDSAQFVQVVMVYLGAQGLADAAGAFKKEKK